MCGEPVYQDKFSHRYIVLSVTSGNSLPQGLILLKVKDVMFKVKLQFGLLLCAFFFFKANPWSLRCGGLIFTFIRGPLIKLLCVKC